ncbi:sulfotransferase [uncultured Microbulbifer sp.]|uniref:tetratricopeptide repeat-containing sulfotransferase family protein n=1 Tax=uncultured Microbulbifer sp. TaxID=348147 RepID=UPI002620246B|nr:sulfotransferase [uncultured Microbulbifer sp.]
MTVPTHISKHLREARLLVESKRFDEAEQLYRKLLSLGGAEEVVYRELFQLYDRQKKSEQAISCIEEMARSFKEIPEWWLQLAQYAQSCKNYEKAIHGYQMFLERVPDRPNTVYNFAYLLRQAGKLEEALNWYQKALAMGVSGKEEVYTNMGVILTELRREPEARANYEKALGVRQSYLPAILNLAALMEECGDRASASALYEKALTVDNACVLAISRLAYLTTVKHPGDPLIERVSSMLANKGLSKADSEELSFSLGKLFDDCGEYEWAFTCYTKANNLGRLRFTPYSKADQSKFIDDLMRASPRKSFTASCSPSGGSPVFICGMFRSGSTLVEQVLSGHSKISSGGELEFFPQLVRNLGDKYPKHIKDVDAGFYANTGKDYGEFLVRRFGQGAIVTDKRPDNFLHLGLIKRALPNSRFIWTRRGLLDNCLSVYFQQLGGDMNYSVDLDSVGHFYVEQERLMRHWQRLFPDSIFEIVYEDLVKNPGVEIRKMLDFLGLDWEDACLDFQQRENYVKTASVWQVRKGLHKDSVNRHQNYNVHVSALKKYLKA